MSTIKLALVDDNKEVRESVLRVLELFDEFEILFEANNGKKAIESLQKNSLKPDVLLLDVEMPVMNGIETLTHVKANYPTVKTLMLSYSEDENYLKQALGMGAAGYLVKGEKPMKMVELIKDTAEGRLSLSPQVAGKAMQMLQRNSKTQKLPQDFGLTPREVLVLKKITEGKNYQEIAEELFISPQTVRTHTENIYRKLDVHSKVEASKIAFENGWG